ncbi:MAG: type I restriction-modification system subunit M N-terminal domain-containing protein [Ruminococcus sp.]|nr:type I restriction-modification system subunit M N-terminal domain-containing protein [Ruminococcus sp.]
MANSALIKSLENIMRIDDGVDGDSQYIGQITWMLFLKAFDAKEMEWEFKPDYKGIIPVGYRWRDWAEDKEGITGDALIKFVGELFEKLKKLDIWLIYTRVYKQHYARFMKKTMSKTEFAQWAEYALDLRQKALDGEIGIEEYTELIRK